METAVRTARGTRKSVPPASDGIQFVSDQDGKNVAVIVPIDIWHEIQSERETAYLLSSETMKHRLLAARARTGGLSLEEVREKLGI